MGRTPASVHCTRNRFILFELVFVRKKDVAGDFDEQVRGRVRKVGGQAAMEAYGREHADGLHRRQRAKFLTFDTDTRAFVTA